MTLSSHPAGHDFLVWAAGLGQISRVVLLNRIATVYVEVIRGIPLLVQIFYIYFALEIFSTWMDSCGCDFHVVLLRGLFG